MKSVMEELGVTAFIADAEFLEKIVEYIDTHGHVKRVLAHNKRRCLLGAAIMVNKDMNIIQGNILDETISNRSIMTGLQHKLYDLLDESPTALNDHPDIEWPEIRDYVLNKAKDLRNNERAI